MDILEIVVFVICLFFAGFCFASAFDNTVNRYARFVAFFGGLAGLLGIWILVLG